MRQCTSQGNILNRRLLLFVKRYLRLLSQSELVAREDRIIEVYFGEEASREEEEHNSEVIVLKNYRDKKGA